MRSDVPGEKPKHFMTIKFLNKAVDAINLPALLRSTSITDKIPVYFREPPIASYEYTSTVASKIFNFAPALSNLNVSEYLSKSQTCQCKESKFCYEPHGHVITGDLRVIENARLRELVAKGPKYREPNSCHSILECCITFSGVKLSMGSFVLFTQTSVLVFRSFSRSLDLYNFGTRKDIKKGKL